LNRNLARLCLAALLFVLPATALAGVRPWVAGSFGTSLLAMGDVNDDIGAINSGDLAGTGAQMEKINNGLNFGGAFGLDVGRDFAFGIAVDRMLAQSEAGTTNASVLFDAPGEVVRGFARYSFWNAGPARGYVEASAGRARTLATLNAQSSEEGTAHAGLEGTGPAYEFAVGLNTPSLSQFALGAALGYRYAKATDVQVEHEPIQNTSGGSYTVDYSGVFLRVGVTLFLTPQRGGTPTSTAPPRK
jgi:hypothetical protein